MEHSLHHHPISPPGDLVRQGLGPGSQLQPALDLSQASVQEIQTTPGGPGQARGFPRVNGYGGGFYTHKEAFRIWGNARPWLGRILIGNEHTIRVVDRLSVLAPPPHKRRGTRDFDVGVPPLGFLPHDLRLAVGRMVAPLTLRDLH